MKRIERAELLDLVEYEKRRDGMRARVIQLKESRRLTLGPNLTLLFENRDTVLLQIEEMIRTERIVDEPKIQGELDAYNALIPEPGELSATLFIELPDLTRLTTAQVRVEVNRFQGLERDAVVLCVGAGHRMAARFEGGHSKEEKMAGVQYLRFRVPDAARVALGDADQEARVAVEHPNYAASAPISAALRAELLRDLTD